MVYNNNLFINILHLSRRSPPVLGRYTLRERTHLNTCQHQINVKIVPAQVRLTCNLAVTGYPEGKRWPRRFAVVGASRGCARTGFRVGCPKDRPPPRVLHTKNKLDRSWTGAGGGGLLKGWSEEGPRCVPPSTRSIRSSTHASEPGRGDAPHCGHAC